MAGRVCDRRELVNQTIRFTVSSADSEEALLAELQAELMHLEAEPGIETTLLIHPSILTQFGDYNEFLDVADGLLAVLDLEGVYQIASFHPDYQFADTEPNDAENYTNRSPFPMLHLLREASVEAAIDRHPDPEGIPERNIALMRELGVSALRQRLSRTHSPMV